MVITGVSMKKAALYRLPFFILRFIKMIEFGRSVFIGQFYFLQWLNSHLSSPFIHADIIAT
ncbi:MAG: hypothetical protein COA46_09525 [Porticoccaceae bacterium]|nr:MAG: hypothetical protein COA46_09525 [Porticoccaceae bacterium]